MIGFETFASEGLVSQDRLTVVIKATPTQRTTGAVSASAVRECARINR
jgi:hypothetical protein